MIQDLKVGLLSEWLKRGVIPPGQVCLALDSGEMKVGNGMAPFARLPVASDAFKSAVVGPHQYVAVFPNLTALSNTALHALVTLTVPVSVDVLTIEATATGAEVTTDGAHGLTSGERVVLSSTDSTPVIDGEWTVTVLDDDHFTVPALGITVPGSTGSVRTPADLSQTVKISNTSAVTRAALVKGNAAGMAGDVLVEGLDPEGNVLRDVIALDEANAVPGVVPMVSFTDYVVPGATNADGDKVSLGLANVFGLYPAPLSVDLVERLTSITIGETPYLLWQALELTTDYTVDLANAALALASVTAGDTVRVTFTA